jgi:hypothetical protein
MILPTFVLPARQTGMAKLKINVFKIGGEALAKKPFDIFEDECLWPQLTNGANGFGKHVALVHVSTVFSTQRKRLTRRPPGHNGYRISKVSIIEIADVHLMEGPMLHGTRVKELILTKCFARIMVPFDHGGMVKSGIRHADGKTSGTGKEFNTVHREISLWLFPNAHDFQSGIPKPSALSSPLWRARVYFVGLVAYSLQAWAPKNRAETWEDEQARIPHGDAKNIHGRKSLCDGREILSQAFPADYGNASDNEILKKRPICEPPFRVSCPSFAPNPCVHSAREGKADQVFSLCNAP